MHPSVSHRIWLGSITALLMLVLSASCHNEEQSDVPNYPVCLDIDIQAEYPHFVPASPCQSLVFKKPRYAQEAVGYAGVVVWININGEYLAADLCCPHCLRRDIPVEVDGMSATCPICGEWYDLTTYGFPQKGISQQPLKRYGVSFSGYKVRVRN